MGGDRKARFARNNERQGPKRLPCRQPAQRVATAYRFLRSLLRGLLPTANVLGCPARVVVGCSMRMLSRSRGNAPTLAAVKGAHE